MVSSVKLQVANMVSSVKLQVANVVSSVKLQVANVVSSIKLQVANVVSSIKLQVLCCVYTSCDLTTQHMYRDLWSINHPSLRVKVIYGRSTVVYFPICLVLVGNRI